MFLSHGNVRTKLEKRQGQHKNDNMRGDRRNRRIVYLKDRADTPVELPTFSRIDRKRAPDRTIGQS